MNYEDFVAVCAFVAVLALPAVLVAAAFGASLTVQYVICGICALFGLIAIVGLVIGLVCDR